MYDSRVLERGCGLTAAVVGAVHVEDKASEKPSTPTSITACFKYGLNRQTPKSVAHPDCVPVPRPPTPNTLALFASDGCLPGSQAETDPQVQQESDISA